MVLGNPPYVRQELFSDLKPYLQDHYVAYHGVADLYVYFYELGLRLLKPGGRLGYISSSSFFKTSSGEPLRRLLTTACQLEVLVDFGDWQVFEGVTTYPAVITAQNLVDGAKIDAAKPAKFLQLTAAVADLSAFFEDNKQSLDLAQLVGKGGEGDDAKAAAEWQLEGVEAAALRAKLTRGHPTLKEAVGSPYRGVLTGLNEAFVIDRATRDKLVYADIGSEGLFKPFLEGKDIKRWQVESEDRWLILMPKGWTRGAMNAATVMDEAVAWAWLTGKHPALAAYLSRFLEAARKRTDQGEYWWELRACAYYAKFEQAKIYYPVISQGAKFCFDDKGYYSNDKGFFVPSNEQSLLGLLNSRAIWFFIQGVCSPLRGGEWRFELRGQNIETLPIPTSTPAQQTQLSTLAEAAAQAASERLQTQRNFARRIHDLLPNPPSKGAQTTLGEALSRWWLLADFTAFQFEVTKRFKADIPLKDRNDWEQWFSAERIRIHQLSANMAATERSIDEVVYTLFGLDAAEVALIERTVQR